MGHKDHSLLPQIPTQTSRKEILSDLRVNRAEGVIEQEDIRIAVAGSRKGDACPLPSRDVDAPLSDVGVESPLQDRQVLLELAHLQHLS